MAYRGQGLKVLQAVKLAGAEFSRCERRFEYDFNNRWREAFDALDCCEQVARQRGKESGVVRFAGRGVLAQHMGHHRVALFCTAHGFDDVAEVRGMQVTKKGNKAAVRHARQQHVYFFRFGYGELRLERQAVFVAGLEVLAVSAKVLRVLARQNGVGRGACSDKNRTGRQVKLTCTDPLAILAHGLAGEVDAACRGIIIYVDRQWRKGLGEADAFFQRFFHLFVIERVRGAVEQAAAVGYGCAAPGAEQFNDVRLAILGRSGGALLADGTGVGEEFLGDLALFRAPGCAHCVFALFPGQHFIALQEFFRLYGVIGE